MQKIVTVLCGLGIIATGIYFTISIKNEIWHPLTSGLALLGALHAISPWTHPNKNQAANTDTHEDEVKED